MNRNTIGAAMTLAAFAGTALGQQQFPQVSANGDPLVGTWPIAPQERTVIGTPGAPGSGVRLNEFFIPAGVNPEADTHASAVYLPDGSGVLVANLVSKNLTVFNPATRALIRNYPLQNSPQSVALTPDGSKAVTANLFESTASIVNLSTGVETVVPVGIYPARIKISPDGTRAIVSCGGQFPNQALYVVNIASGTVERQITSGFSRGTFSINFESQGFGFRASGPTIVDNTTLLYPDFANSQVRIIDYTNGNTTLVPTAANPNDIVVVGTKAYVSHFFPTALVSEIDIPTATVTRTFTLPSEGNGPISVNGLGTRLAVAVQNNTVIIDIPTGTVSGNLATASVNELYTTADGNYALTVGFNGSVMNYATETIVGNSNQFVSCDIGAVSPTASQAVMFSQTFGEDMVVVNTGAAPSLVSGGPSGPVPEGDKTRVVAFSPDGTRAIAVNQFSQTATIVDSASHSQLTLVPIGRRPGNAAFTPDGSKAVVTSRDGTAATIVNMSNFTTVDVPISTRADQVQISPDGHYAYIAVVASGDGVWRIDLTNNTTPGGKLATGDMGSYFQNYSEFSGMTLSHSGNTIVTCNTASNDATIINAATWTVQATIPFGTGNTPARALFSPDDSKIYMTLIGTDRIAVINNAGASSSIAGFISTGDAPVEMVMKADGSRIYVQNSGTPTTVGVVDTASMSQVSTIAFATNPTIDGMALSPDGTKLYVSHSSGSYTIGNGGLIIAQSNVLSTVDTATNAITDNLAGPNLAAGLAISQNGAYLGMPNLMSEGLTIVPLGSVCYANCDASTTSPILNVADFTCFLQKFAAGDTYANCDASTTQPVLNVADFTCFLQKFAAGCP